MSKLPVTVMIPVRNEQANLGRCLNALGRFSEVIVIDSSSTDNTVEIATAFGARVIQFVWNGHYPKKRNWALLNHPPAHPWVLFLDADEIVDERFCDALRDAIHDTRHVGFWINYTNYFLGRRLCYGVPQRKLALICVGRGLYERVDEAGWSGLDMEVHEHPIVDGTTGVIESPVEHNDDRGLLKFTDRHINYAKWEARRYSALHQGPAEVWESLSSRQNTKYRNLGRWWYPWAYFAYQYLVKRGFLDGYAGFQYAIGKLWYFNAIYVLIREKDIAGEKSSLRF